MMTTDGGDALAQVVRKTILALVRRDEADLTSRQFGVFLTVYLTAGPHTVRGLAARLNISKPVITRAVNRLSELSLARREGGPDGSPQRHSCNKLKRVMRFWQTCAKSWHTVRAEDRTVPA